MLGGQPDVEVCAQRSGDLLGEEAARRPAGDAADDLAHDEALGQRVVARRGTRLPARRLGGQPGRDGRPVVQVPGSHRAVEVRQARGVGQHVPDLHALLARGGELRPVPGHRRGQVEIAAVGEDQRAQRRHRLGGGPDVGDGVRSPRDRAGRIGVPAPEVHRRLTVQVDRGRGTDVVLVQRLGQRLTDGLESLVAHAANLDHGLNLTGPTPAQAIDLTGHLLQPKPAAPGARASASAHRHYEYSGNLQSILRFSAIGTQVTWR